MRIKSDFVTNSSSTNYIVIETWELKSGDIKIYKDDNKTESIDITKKFIDFVLSLDNRGKYAVNFSVAVDDDHLQLGFGETVEESDHGEIELSTGKNGNNIYLSSPQFTLNVYNDKSLSCGFHYTTAESSKLLNKAINLMVTDFIKMLGINNEIEIEIERRIFDFSGDGWDGGDPCFGYYGNSLKCKRAIECKRILIVNKGK